MDEREAINAAKADPVCKSDGFAIAKMSDGFYDYFPGGQPPNKNGNPDRNAEIIGKWRWNPNTNLWNKIA